uniref:Uncharacterized protein n=1 Tax=Pipistrellus kuhlii TaxID=59472 RepID=A0A7J7XB82_PIPKU|nr:hypothetical protein mPipKuh1_010648 [Pipistrellus kuhlii]
MPPPPLGPPRPAALVTLNPGSRPPWWVRMLLPWTGFLRAALRSRPMCAVVGDLLCAPWAQRVPGAQETGVDRAQGFLSLGLSPLSADWTASEQARVACAHATPPSAPCPRVLPQHHHRHTLLSTLFSFLRIFLLLLPVSSSV